jgi:hypothetical protein
LGVCPLCVVQPNLEVALLLQSPTSDSQEPISCLVTLNKVHATWLNQCIPTDLSKAEVSKHVPSHRLPLPPPHG